MAAPWMASDGRDRSALHPLALAALVLQALIEWLTDRIGEMGYAG